MDITVSIAAVDHCNYHCSGCSHFSPYKEINNHHQSEYMDDLEKIQEWTNVISVAVGGGEPFLHPNFEEFMLDIKSVVKTKLQIMSNGYWIKNKKEWIDKFKNIANAIGITLHPESPFGYEEAKNLTSRLDGSCDKRYGEDGGWYYMRFSNHDIGNRKDPRHKYPCPCHRFYELKDGFLYPCCIQAYCEESLSSKPFFNGTKLDRYYVRDGNKDSFNNWLDKEEYVSCHYCLVGYERHIQKYENF